MIGTACRRPDLQNRRVTMPKAGSLETFPGSPQNDAETS